MVTAVYMCAWLLVRVSSRGHFGRRVSCRQMDDVVERDLGQGAIRTALRRHVRGNSVAIDRGCLHLLRMRPGAAARALARGASRVAASGGAHEVWKLHGRRRPMDLCATLDDGCHPGSALTCFLLHGFLGDRRDLEPVRRKLSSLGRFNVVALDFPHHGDAARLSCKGACGGSTAVAAVENAIERFTPAGGRVILVGYSMGGRLALQLASRNESRVAAVVVLGSNPGIEDVDQRAERAQRDEKLASRLRAMTPSDFDAWLRNEWYRAPHIYCHIGKQGAS